MGDMGEVFRAIKEDNKKRSHQNLDRAEPILKYFDKHTKYHYSIILNGSKLDYWPTKNKWRYKDKNFTGLPNDLFNFIKGRR